MSTELEVTSLNSMLLFDVLGGIQPMDIPVCPSEVLTAETCVGHDGQGHDVPSGTVADLLLRLEPHTSGGKQRYYGWKSGCPFHKGPSAKGVGVSVSVDAIHNKLRVICNDLSHKHDASSYVNRPGISGNGYHAWEYIKDPALKTHKHPLLPMDTDVELAKLAIREMQRGGAVSFDGTDFRQVVREHKSPLLGTWQRIPVDAIAEHLRRYSGTLFWASTNKKGEVTHVPVLITDKKIRSTIAQMQSTLIYHALDGGTTSRKSKWDTRKHTLPLQGGCYIFDRGTIQFQTPAKVGDYAENYIRSECACPYAPNTKAATDIPETWNYFLNYTFPTEKGDNYEKICVLQEFLGLAIAREANKQEAHIMLAGTDGGQNGKGTISNVLKALLPAGAFGGTDLGQLEDKFSVASMENIWVNVVSEQLKGVTPVRVFKKVSSQDTVEAQNKYGPLFHLQLNTAWILACNETFRPSDYTGSFLRRLIVLGCDERISDQDKDTNLLDKLKLELPGILGWCLEGYRRYHRQGTYTHVPSSAVYKQAWIGKLDNRVEWLTECCAPCIVTATTGVTMADAYTSYKNWCDRVGRQGVVAESNLRDAIVAKFGKTVATRTTNKFGMAFTGSQISRAQDMANSSDLLDDK